MAQQQNTSQQQAQALAVRLGEYKGSIEKLKPVLKGLLPRHQDVERFAKLAYLEGYYKPKLLDDMRSLIAAFIKAAQMGLEIDSRGHAYLVPFWNSRLKRYQTQLIPGYKGLMDLAYRSDRVLSITYGIVYENEKYRYEGGLKPVLEHSPLPVSKRGQKKIAVYAVAQIKGGATAYVWMWEEEVLAIRDKSASYQAFKAKRASEENTIWIQYENDMFVKTAIRKLCKFIPQSSELARAIAVDELQEAGGDATFEIREQLANALAGQDEEDFEREKAELEKAAAEQTAADERAKKATESKQEDLKEKVKDGAPKAEQKEEKKDGGAEKKEGSNGK